MTRSSVKEFMEAGKERLARNSVRDATREEIGYLKRESQDLKQLVADLALEVHRFKKRSFRLFRATVVQAYERWGEGGCADQGGDLSRAQTSRLG